MSVSLWRMQFVRSGCYLVTVIADISNYVTHFSDEDGEAGWIVTDKDSVFIAPNLDDAFLVTAAGRRISLDGWGWEQSPVATTEPDKAVDRTSSALRTGAKALLQAVGEDPQLAVGWDLPHEDGKSSSSDSIPLKRTSGAKIKPFGILPSSPRSQRSNESLTDVEEFPSNDVIVNDKRASQSVENLAEARHAVRFTSKSETLLKLTPAQLSDTFIALRDAGVEVPIVAEQNEESLSDEEDVMP